MIFYDSTYLLVLIGMVLCLAASGLVKTTYAKYAKVRAMSGLTGKTAAERILRDAGLFDVRIERIRGNLTDNYDSRTKVLHLSDSTYDSPSVAAVGVAAHECGHAIQHARGYAPLGLRSLLVPAANFGSRLAWPLIIVGLLLGQSGLLFLDLGIVAFALAVLFQIVNLPVEFNASGRAVRILRETGMLNDMELKGTKKVLSAAAMTYVAATASSILQMLRLILIRDRRS